METALVLAAPGQRELREQRPAAGQTGVNLDGILGQLHGIRPDLFPSASRLDYRIVNAVAFALYRSRDGRTMPRPAEVMEARNVERLSGLLAGYRTIVAFSPPADLAVRAIGRVPDLSFHHPSMTRLNSLYPRLGGTRPWRVSERHRLFAADLLAG